MKLSASIAAGACLTFVCAANAQTPGTAVPPPAAPQQFVSGPSLALAKEAADAAIEACHNDGASISVVITDETGAVKLVEAADGARVGRVEVAERKAYTVLTYKTDGIPLFERYKADSKFADEVKADPKLSIFPGARLIKVGDRIVGVIGVSGSPKIAPQGDDPCAAAGLNQIAGQLK